MVSLLPVHTQVSERPDKDITRKHLLREVSVPASCESLQTAASAAVSSSICNYTVARWHKARIPNNPDRRAQLRCRICIFKFSMLINLGQGCELTFFKYASALVSLFSFAHVLIKEVFTVPEEEQTASAEHRLRK